MTISVSNNTPRVSYSVSQGATTTSFTVNFEFFAAADLNVYVDDTLKTITTHYTVSGGNGSTGTVSMSVTGATGGSTVVITRDIALERTTDFPSQGAFNISSLNTELDKLVAIDADVDDTIGRSIRLQDSDSAVSMELPLKAARVGTVLGFNATTGAAEAGPTIANVNSLSAITANINTVAGIQANVTTVAGIQANVTTVAGISSAVSSVAGVASLITSDFVSDLNTLATSAIVEDLNILATTDVVSDLNTLATSDIVADLNKLATDDIVSDLNTLATTDIVSDLNTLATSDIVTDLNLLATSAIVEDLNLLATSSVIADMASLAGSGGSPNITALTASGVITGATLEATGDTSAGDNAAIGYTSAEGLILTGQGSTNDVRIKNDADNDVIEIPTGTTNVTIAGNLGVGGTVTGTGTSVFADLDISGDVDVDGTLEADAMTLNGTSITTTATLSTGISNGNVLVANASVVDNDFLRVDGTSIEGRSASELLSDIGGTTEATAEANSVALAIALG